MKITFIGGGNMASALIGGMLAGSHRAADVMVVDPDANSRERIAQRFGVAVHARADATALDGDVVVLAVKPQQMPEVAKGIAPVLSGQLVISVAAGIRSADLSRWLGGHGRIVRTMPNTPALIGEGITALVGAPGLAVADRDAADSIMRAVGQTVWVDDESMIDAVTAVSGSGPAYVFYFMEAMQAAARAMGFDDAQSRKLTRPPSTGRRDSRRAPRIRQRCCGNGSLRRVAPPPRRWRCSRNAVSRRTSSRRSRPPGDDPRNSATSSAGSKRRPERWRPARSAEPVLERETARTPRRRTSCCD